MIAGLVIVFAALAGGPAALAQVPSVLEEIKVVTEDAGSASFILRFSPEEPQFSAISTNPSRPELLMRATVRAPRVQPRSVHNSLIRTAVLEPSDTGLRLRFDTAAPAEISAQAAGDRAIQVTLTRLSEAEATGIRPIGTNPE